jgi:hypothetical protein
MNRALAVEMRCCVVLIQIGKHCGERVSSVQNIRRFGRLAIHKDREGRVFGKERHLPLGVPPVGAMGIGVNQLPNRKAVGGHFGRDWLCHGLSFRAQCSSEANQSKRVSPDFPEFLFAALFLITVLESSSWYLLDYVQNCSLK